MAMTCPRGTIVQTLLLDRRAFPTPAHARRWAIAHGYRATKVHTTARFHRIRQASPSRFERGSFRTIRFAQGIEAVIGCPNASTLRRIRG